jgi:hypothetical protein
MWPTDYKIWFNFHSFYLGVSLGLMLFAIQEKIYPVVALSLFMAIICSSYISIIFWMESSGYLGGKK